MDPRIVADAQRWCDATSNEKSMRVNTGPHVEILSTTAGDTTVILALEWFQLWEFPQSGSGWGDYYARAIEATFGDKLAAVRVIATEHVHVTEGQDDSFDIEPTLAALRAVALAVR